MLTVMKEHVTHPVPLDGLLMPFLLVLGQHLELYDTEQWA